MEEKLEYVAGGAGVVILPSSALDYYTLPDLARVPIRDLEPMPLVLAWEESRQSDLLAEYAEVARQRHRA